MATTRSVSGPAGVAALTGLFVGVHAVIAVEAGLFSRSVDPAAPSGLMATTAWRPVRAPLGPIAKAVPADDVPEDEAPPQPPETVAAAAESPPRADAASPPPVALAEDEPTDPVPEVGPTGKPAADLPAPRWTPEQLQASLLHVPEVSLGHPAALAVPRTGRATRDVQPLLGILDARPDLRGLPARRGPGLQLTRAESDAFRDTSVLLRKGLGEVVGQQGRQNRRLIVRPEVLTARPAVVARVLHQMLQVESVPLRKLLLAQLTAMHDPAASRGLAHRAVYEPVAELRQAAVRALAARPAAEYLPALFEAFANPWAPAADSAADALIALAPADAVPELIHRLDSPDPSAPVPGDDGTPVVRELVRVNHARNCLLCHAQSVSSRDNIRVAAPSPVRPLPSPFSLANYEGGGRGGSRTPPDTVFARPDVTYLKQDFSWVLPVANPGPWPGLQRFDFMLRTRPAASGELAPGGEFPQRRAVVRALRALTGKDFGDRAADWRAGLAVAKNGD